MEIKVFKRGVFGVVKIYPACDKARTFAAMVGQKTLTIDNLNHIVRLGYYINYIMDPSL